MTTKYFLGVVPYTKYAFYWEVTDNTVGRVAPSEVRYGDILSAVLDAEKHIREDLSTEEQNHILIIKVFDKSLEERRAGTFTPVYTETFGQEPSDTVFLAGDPRRPPRTPPLWETPGGVKFPDSLGEWIELAELIKVKVPGLTNETNEHLNTILLTPEDADVDVAKQWLVDKGRDLGIQ